MGIDTPSSAQTVSELQEIKSRIHHRLMDRLNLKLIDELETDVVRHEIGELVRELLLEEDTPLNLEEREKLVREVQDEVLGLGPLEPLLADNTVSDILVNTFKQIYVE